MIAGGSVSNNIRLIKPIWLECVRHTYERLGYYELGLIGEGQLS